MEPMKRYSIFHIPLLAFFSKALYRDVGLRWTGSGFAYLLLLLLLCWIPYMILLDIGVSRVVRDIAPPIVSQVPTLTIVNGLAAANVPQPYTISDPETGKALVIIDTTGSIASLDKTDAVALVTKTSAIVRKNRVETQTIAFNEIKDFTVDKDKVTRWLEALKKFLMPIVFPIAVLGSFVYRIVQVLVYAAIGLLFANGCRSERTYLSLVRLSVVAVTPSVVLGTTLDMAGIAVPAFGVVYFLMTLVYLYLGVRAVAEEERQSVAQPG